MAVVTKDEELYKSKKAAVNSAVSSTNTPLPSGLLPQDVQNSIEDTSVINATLNSNGSANASVIDTIRKNAAAQNKTATDSNASTPLPSGLLPQDAQNSIEDTSVINSTLNSNGTASGSVKDAINSNAQTRAATNAQAAQHGNVSEPYTVTDGVNYTPTGSFGKEYYSAENDLRTRYEANKATLDTDETNLMVSEYLYLQTQRDIQNAYTRANEAARAYQNNATAENEKLYLYYRQQYDDLVKTSAGKYVDYKNAADAYNNQIVITNNAYNDYNNYIVTETQLRDSDISAFREWQKAQARTLDEIYEEQDKINAEIERINKERKLTKTKDALGVSDTSMTQMSVDLKSMKQTDYMEQQGYDAQLKQLSDKLSRLNLEAEDYYSNITKAPDFAENSRYESKWTGQTKTISNSVTGGTQTIGGSSDLVYDAVNGNTDARNMLIANDVSRKGIYGTDHAFLNYLDDTQIGVYNYLYKTEGKESAEKYLNTIKPRLESKANGEIIQRVKTYADAHPFGSVVGGTIFTVTAAPAKIPEYIMSTLDTLAGQTVNTSDMSVTKYIDTVRQQNTEDFGTWVGNLGKTEEARRKWANVGKFVYGTTTSMLDFLYTSALAGTLGAGGVVGQKGMEVVSLGIMGTEAAASATYEALERGLSQDKAVVLGAIAGFAEILTEKVSVENLFNESWDNGLKFFIKNTLSEGSEEVGSDIINLFADILIAQDKSEYRQQVNDYINNGLTTDQAFSQVFWDEMKQMGLDFLGGSISGGVMAGVALRAKQHGTNSQYESLGELIVGLGDEVVDNYIELAKTSTDEAIRAEAAALENKLEQHQALSELEVGKLAAEVMNNESQQTGLPVETTPATNTAEQAGIRDNIIPSNDTADSNTAENATQAATDKAQRMADAASELERTAIEYDVDEQTYNRVRRVCEALNVNAAFYNSDAKNGFIEDGYYDGDGVLHINAKSQKAAVKIISHELTHKLESSNTYGDFSEWVKSYIGENEYNNRVSDITRTYTEAGVQSFNADHEAIANFVESELITNENAVYSLVNYKRNLAQRVLDWMKRAVSKVTKNGGEAATLNHGIELFQKALSETNTQTTITTNETVAQSTPTAAQNTPTVERDNRLILPGNEDGAATIEAADNVQIDNTIKLPGGNDNNERITESRAKASENDSRDGRRNADDGRSGSSGEPANRPKRADSARAGVFRQNNAKAENAPRTTTKELQIENGTDSLITVYPEKLWDNELQTAAKAIENSTGREAVFILGKLETEVKGKTFRSVYIEDGNYAYIQADNFKANVQQIADKIQYLDNIINDSNRDNVLNKLYDTYGDEFIGNIINNYISHLSGIYPLDGDNAEKNYKRILDEMLSDAYAGINSFGSGASRMQEGTRSNTQYSVSRAVEDGAMTFESDNSVQLSMSTYKSKGRQALEDYITSIDDISHNDKYDLIKQLDEIYDVCEKYKDKFVEFGKWSEAEVITDDGGNPVMSVVVPNGEYPLNIDFSTICKKRQTLNAVLNALVKKGALTNKLSGPTIMNINNMLRDEGFEVACALCFVDAKRYNIDNWANRFANKWNGLIDSLGGTADTFNYVSNTTARGMTDEGLDFSTIDDIIARGKNDELTRMAKLIKENPEQRNYIDHSNLISSVGFDNIKRYNPELYSIVNASGGTSKPKIAHTQTQYISQIIADKNFNPEDAFKVGGVRIQSFSDYMGNMFFDYVQMVGDLEAKKLPAHAYTKEVNFVKLFGMCGIKINMSLVPGVFVSEEDRTYFNTLTNAQKDKDARWKAAKAHAGLDENGNYIWGTETFNYDTAIELQNDERYTKNVGTIAVGVSDAHIFKLLSDPNIRMVIPYHKSGINRVVAQLGNIDLFNDYTYQQHTRRLNTNGKWANLNAQQEFDYYADLAKTNDAKHTAANYIHWCEENGYRPKFHRFAYNTDGSINENYYKLLTDFAVYDNDGYYTPQEAVHLELPSDYQATLEDSLREEQNRIQKLDASLESTVDKIQKELLGNKQHSISRTREGIARAKSDVYDKLNSELIDRVVLFGQDHGYLGTAGITNDSDTTQFGAVTDAIYNLTDFDSSDDFKNRWKNYQNAVSEWIYRVNNAEILMQYDRIIGSLVTALYTQNEAQLQKTLDKVEPYFAKQDLKRDIMNLFSIPDGAKKEVGRIIERFADEMIAQGSLSQESRNALFNELYERGVMTIEADEYFKQGRETVLGEHIYVSPETKAEFGDDWAGFRKRAFAAGIYLTNDKQNIAVNSYNNELADAMPGTFNKEDTDMRGILEKIVQLAEEGKDEQIPLAEYVDIIANENHISSEDVLLNLENQIDRKLEDFAGRAKLETYFRNRGTNRATEEMNRHRTAEAEEKTRHILSEAEEKERHLETEKRQRENYRRNNAKAAEYRREQLERQRERRDLHKLQESTRKNIEWLVKNRQKAPHDMQEHWDAVIDGIDYMAVNRIDSTHLPEWVMEVERYEWAKKNDPNWLPSKRLEELTKRLDYKKLADFDVGQLQLLYEITSQMRQEFYNRNNLLKADRQDNLFDIYDNIRDELENAPNEQLFTTNGRSKSLKNLFNAEQLSPTNMLQMMGGWNPNGQFAQMARELEDGEREQNNYRVRAVSTLKDFYNENKEWVKNCDGQGKHGIWYEMEVPPVLEYNQGDAPIYGKPVKVYFTPAQKVHMYLESKNYANLNHMIGGRTFVNKELYQNGDKQNAFAKGTTIRLTPETVKSITANLTTEEKQLADLLEKYYNGMSKNAINSVSRVLEGYDKAPVQNYAPIVTNDGYTKSEYGVFDTTVEGAGSLKKRVWSLTPSINISALEAFERNVKQTSRYVGLAIPIRDITAILNTSGANDNIKVKGLIIDKYGVEALNYIEKMLTDLQSYDDGDYSTISSTMDKIFGMGIRSTFAANLSIMSKQFGSYWMAMPYLGAENMPGVFKIFKKADYDLINTYTQQLEYRSMGYTTPEVAQYASKAEWQQKNKFIGFVLGGDQLIWMDKWTASRLWQWAENKVRNEKPNVNVGTAEDIKNGNSPFYKLVTQEFNNAVGKSQSTTDYMHNGNIRRSKHVIDKTFTMFKSDASQAYNELRQFIGEYQYYKRVYDNAADKTDVKKNLTAAKKRIGTAMAGIFASNLWAAIVNFLNNGLKYKFRKYKDDEDELTIESVLKELGIDLGTSLTGIVVGAEELADAITAAMTGKKWYGIEIAGIEETEELIENTITLAKGLKDDITAIINIASNGGNVSEYLRKNAGNIMSVIHDGAATFSNLTFAFPTKNLEAYTLGLLSWFAPQLTTGYNNLFKKVTKSTLNGLHGTELTQTVNDLMHLRVDNGISNDTAKELSRLYEAGYDGAIPTNASYSFTVNGEEVKLNAYEQQVYDRVWREIIGDSIDVLIKSRDYINADDDMKAKMLNYLYTYAGNIAKSETAGSELSNSDIAAGKVAQETNLADYAIWKAMLGNEENADKYSLLLNSDFTDEVKYRIVCGELGYETENEGKPTQYAKLAELNLQGMSIDKYLELHSKYGTNAINAIYDSITADDTDLNGMTIDEYADLYCQFKYDANGKTREKKEYANLLIEYADDNNLDNAIVETLANALGKGGIDEWSQELQLQYIESRDLKGKALTDAVGEVLGFDTVNDKGDTTKYGYFLEAVNNGMSSDEALMLYNDGVSASNLAKYADTDLSYDDIMQVENANADPADVIKYHDVYGLELDTAITIDRALAELEETDNVSKMTAAWEATKGMDDEERIRAIGAATGGGTNNNQYEKMAIADYLGIDLNNYMGVIAIKDSYNEDGKNNLKKGEIVAAIEAYYANIAPTANTKREKAIIFQLIAGTGTNNPYSGSTKAEIKKYWDNYDAEGILELPS